MVGITLFLSKLLSIKRPTPLKLSSYECGEEPSGNSWVQFNTRFYVVALVFLLFDVEMVFIFPWTTIFAKQSLLSAAPAWGWLTLTEMFIFVGILLLGLLYIWKRGDLNWIKPEQKLPAVDTAIPKFMYDRINSETYEVKPFAMEATGAESTPPAVISTPAAPKPAFKPTFRKKNEP